MQRRHFLAQASLAARPAARTKRARLLDWLAGKTNPAYTPAAFFLHFGPDFKAGSAAARRHLDYFRQTDMDFLKIQFEQTYERQPFLQKPEDWAKLQLRRLDFYEPLLVTVREVMEAAKGDALVLMTLYSPYMSAGHCATTPLLRQHLAENPDAVKRGLDIITESQMLFVRACIDLGVDGFYMSTQGSETKQFADPSHFTRYVKPYDLIAMREAHRACPFNILHVCDYHASYASYAPVLDYPGQVVNCSTKLTANSLTPAEIARLFQRPYMGGLDRHGLIASGSLTALDAEIRRVIQAAPPQFMLGADCTVAADTDWQRLRHAIATAHNTRRA